MYNYTYACIFILYGVSKQIGLTEQHKIFFCKMWGTQSYVRAWRTLVVTGNKRKQKYSLLFLTIVLHHVILQQISHHIKKADGNNSEKDLADFEHVWGNSVRVTNDFWHFKVKWKNYSQNASFLIPDWSMVIPVEVWKLVLELGRVEACQLLSSNFVIFKYKVVWSGGPKGGISKTRILLE